MVGGWHALSRSRNIYFVLRVSIAAWISRLGGRGDGGCLVIG